MTNEEINIFLEELNKLPPDEAKIKIMEYLDLSTKKFDETIEYIESLKPALTKNRNLRIEDLYKKAERIKQEFEKHSEMIKKKLSKNNWPINR